MKFYKLVLTFLIIANPSWAQHMSFEEVKEEARKIFLNTDIVKKALGQTNRSDFREPESTLLEGDCYQEVCTFYYLVTLKIELPMTKKDTVNIESVGAVVTLYSAHDKMTGSNNIKFIDTQKILNLPSLLIIANPSWAQHMSFDELNEVKEKAHGIFLNTDIVKEALGKTNRSDFKEPESIFIKSSCDQEGCTFDYLVTLKIELPMTKKDTVNIESVGAVVTLYSAHDKMTGSNNIKFIDTQKILNLPSQHNEHKNVNRGSVIGPLIHPYKTYCQ